MVFDMQSFILYSASAMCTLPEGFLLVFPTCTQVEDYIEQTQLEAQPQDLSTVNSNLGPGLCITPQVMCFSVQVYRVNGIQ